MKFEVEDAEGYQVVRCHGIMNSSARESIDDVIHPIIEEKSSRMLIDLAGVERITSEGISLLVTLVARANTKGSHIVFAQPTPFVQAIFDTTKINRFLATEESFDEGVRRLLEPAEDAAS